MHVLVVKLSNCFIVINSRGSGKNFDATIQSQMMIFPHPLWLELHSFVQKPCCIFRLLEYFSQTYKPVVLVFLSFQSFTAIIIWIRCLQMWGNYLWVIWPSSGSSQAAIRQSYGSLQAFIELSICHSLRSLWDWKLFQFCFPLRDWLQIWFRNNQIMFGILTTLKWYFKTLVGANKELPT